MPADTLPLQRLSALGQSVWVDYLSRESIRGGQLHELAAQGGDASAVFWKLAEQDILDACDVFRPVWDEGGGRDGYVSLEVDPRLAYDTLETFREAIRLHNAIER